ncbi:MAG: Sua5/YciO/YrdC/YwlC family translation factor [Parcubacteria group bacterium Gr01-1014_48]|nr:MAG: Sua5/YciO/YrdC/YwlC family translation factor [Parcubacteria group bacterium Greene0416_14]TSC73214.1 MAG: Sua5/YciO/YrdC/YwlC family translation factor [Parcubacteria group bacterium Gr01-1014_48]TSD00478.1 MAG: Sua5/YciO/YrdC/YwlC family translation factor [Parcubacteria group bacterium Greene1014_15]TSD08387.1 MAG: Sua5/YciO/YrdC/YwlC family translation factor [Parcubacteria group bacterium Greene0714_4]
MKIVLFQPPAFVEKDAAYVRGIFESGGVIVFPSDTAYGLAANPCNAAAVQKIFDIKQRPINADISCIFRNLEEARIWAEINQDQEKILKSCLPGSYTFLLQATKMYPLSGKVGVRIPNSDLTRFLSSIFRSPYTATSANISGRPSLYTAEDVVKEFENMNMRPDLILDAGPLMAGRISTVIDLTQDTPKIVRQGSGRFLAV